MKTITITPEITYTCPFCCSIFHKKSFLKHHIRQHNYPENVNFKHIKIKFLKPI